MNLSQKKMCTEEKIGYVLRFIPEDAPEPHTVVVGYEVECIEFEFQEKIAYRNKIIKEGNTIVGMSRETAIPDLLTRNDVIIRYNPMKPNKAYLDDNA